VKDVRSKIQRVIRIILKSAGVALLIAIAVGFVYEEVGQRQDRQRLLAIRK